MLGSKFPDQEVTGEEALVYVCVCVCIRAFVCANAAGQCVCDKNIRLRDETWCQILARCH